VILLIDNYDSFTWNLVQRLGELDPSLEPVRDLIVARNDEITPEAAAALDGGRGPSHVIISPGPCTPREAGISAAVIRRFEGVVPVLGVCLGHQTLADAAGMTVSQHRVPVHGKTSMVHHDGEGIFQGLRDPFEATRYHSLVVLEETIPPPPPPGEAGWGVSAWTTEEDEAGRACRVVMGLRRVWGKGEAGRAAVDGVQFHPESFLTREGPRLLANFLRSGPRGREVDERRVEAIVESMPAGV